MNKKIPILLAYLLVTPIFFSSFAQAAPSLAAKHYVAAGKKEFKAKEYDNAIEQFRKALLADPDDEEALMYLKMLGFGAGEKDKLREQDPAAAEKVAEKKTDSKATKKSVKKDKKDQKYTKDKNKKDKASSGSESNGEDPVVEEIEVQIEREEKAALKALREEAAQEEKVALEKIRKKQSKGQAKEHGKTQKKKAAKKSSKTSAPKKATSAKTEPRSKSASSATVKSVSQDVEEKAQPEKAEVVKDVEIAEDAEIEKILESMVAEEEIEKETPLEKKDIVQKSAAVKTGVEHSVEDLEILGDTKVVKDDVEILENAEDLEDVEIVEQADAVKSVTPASREAALVQSIRKEAVNKEKQLQRQVDLQTAKKIEKVHQEFSTKPVGKNEKTVLRDLDEDGIPEELTVKEIRAIEKIEAQAAKEKQVGAQKIRKQAVQVEKVAVKKLRAQIKKEEKQKAKNNKSRSKPADTARSVVPAAEESDVEITEEEVEALAEIREDFAQKENDIELKYATKKAMRFADAEKKSKAQPQAQEEKVMLAASESEAEEHVLVEEAAAAPAPKSVQAQNVVLKKKLVRVVEMSQKDQDVIRDLENNVRQQDEKVDALEGDLRETKVSLDSKVELLAQKEVKLKELSQRIEAMESDLSSKQYDFKDKQLEYEKKLQAIEEEFGKYKSERANTEEELKEQLRILKEALEKKIAELNAVQEKLIFTENKLEKSEAQFAETIKKYDDVRNTLKDLEDRLAVLGMGSDSPVDEDKAPLVEIDPKNLPAPKNQNEVVYQQWIKRQDVLVTKLKDKLLWAREQIEFLGRYDISLTDQKMAALKEQLAEVKKQLSAHVPSGRTEEDFALMEERFKDSQERLEMVEKILREKDTQVLELEKQLNEVLSAF